MLSKITNILYVYFALIYHFLQTFRRQWIVTITI